jgi:diaminohydroxyphosphoribosylaminopyrimidine deaminase/5-amino-6-(5-phosphoribosylamino)uracil reductase
MDPNPLASGGTGYLQKQGLEVVTGVYEKACRQINYPFIKHVNTGLPWVVMKAALSLDGRITYQQGRGGAITGKKSKEFVHGLRNRLDAILIGADTAAIDNPSLTTRLSDQESRDPLRIIIDSRLRIEPRAKILQQQSNASTWIFCTSQAPKEKHDILCRTGAIIYNVSATDKGQVDLKDVLQILGENSITSLLVEGGATIHGSFLSQGLVDEVYLFLAPFFIGDTGLPLLDGYSVIKPDQAVRLKEVTVQQVGEDCLIHGFLS